MDDGKFAPYAPKKAVLGVLRRYRETGLSEPLTLTGLASIGIPHSTTSRTLQTLRFLGLVDDGGNLTEAAKRLKRASTAEYAGVLADIVRAAYESVFVIVDPTLHDATAISDAFRPYEPSKQRDKMIVLFLALCEEAGIVEHQPRKRGARTASPRVNPRPRTVEHPRALMRGQYAGLRDDYEMTPGDRSLIAAVIQQLPRDGRWTASKREAWMNIMRSAVDLLIELTDRDQQGREEMPTSA